MVMSLTFCYPLTASHIDEAKADLLALLSAPGELVTIEFAQVTAIDSPGLAVMAAFLTSMQKQHPDVPVQIHNLRGLPAKLFAMTRLEQGLANLSVC